MTGFIETIATLQAATVAARKRTGDDAISTNVEAGKVEVCRVTYPDGVESAVEPIASGLTVDAAVAVLDGLGA
jgi:hypothetical protein